MEAAESGGRARHVNLITQQRRLRHLRNIAARNISVANKAKEPQSLLETYFTLHLQENSPAFYTSEKIQDSLNPTWREFETSSMFGCSSYVIVRVWGGHGKQYSVIIEWKVHLSGLIYLGEQIHKDGKSYTPNTLIFGLIDGYYGAPDKEMETRNIPLSLNNITVDSCTVRKSYSINSLSRIHTVQRAIKQTQALVNKVHQGIEKKLLSAKKENEKLAEQELLLLQVNLLHEELQIQKANHQIKKDLVKKEQESNNERDLELTSRFQALKKEKDRIAEMRKFYIDTRESFVKTNAQLMMRKKQLISELSFIYPIHELLDNRYSICGVHLPNSEDFAGHDEVMIAVALGYVCHLVIMVSQFLHIPLRYPITHYGSISKIRDHITDKISDRDRDFPLYSKGKDKLRFSYGVYLLNKNIAQLRYFCGLGTQDLRATLYNLKTLLELRLGVRFDQTSLQQNLPLRSSPILLESSTETKRPEDNLSNKEVVSRTTEEIENHSGSGKHLQVNTSRDHFPRGSPDGFFAVPKSVTPEPLLNQSCPETQDWIRDKFLDQNSSVPQTDTRPLEEEYHSSDDHQRLYFEANLRAWSSKHAIPSGEDLEPDCLSLSCNSDNPSNNKFCDAYRPAGESSKDIDQCKEACISQQFTTASCGALREVITLD